ncbi:MAG: hypothetical protein LKJ36_04370 [Lactobacillus sp.]|jgi:hypothetical protein|nr:hypothetical protein [Lactobacillus sp.]
MEKLKKWINRAWPYAGLALVSLFLLYTQWLYRITPISGDTYFHYSRFYDAAMQIRNWNFSYFQTNYGFDQAGRVINAMYGPLFAYGMGVLVLLTHSWFRFKLISSFLFVLIGSSGMYHLCWRMTKNKETSFLIALAYIGLSKLTYWQSVSNFAAINEMLAPFVMLCGVRMITNHDRPINWVQLGLTMAVVGQIHLLSCLIFSIALIPFFIMGLVTTKQAKTVWLNFAGAIALAALLTMNVWLVLIHFFIAERIFTPYPMSLAENSLKIQTIPRTIVIPLTWIFLFACLLNGIYLLKHRREDKTNNLIFCNGLAFFLLSTDLIPWGYIEAKLPVLQTAFQNPKRFLIVADTLLLLSLGMTFSRVLGAFSKSSKVHSLLVISLLLVAMSGYIKVNDLNNFYTYFFKFNSGLQQVNNAAADRNLDLLFQTVSSVPSPDYLPKRQEISSKHAQEVYKQEVIDRKQQFKHQVLANSKLRLTWTNSGKTKKKTKLPIVMYRESKLVTKSKLYKIDAIGVPTVYSRPGKNEATLSFRQPSWFKWILWLVLVNWAAAIFLACWQRVRFRAQTAVS